MRRLRPEHLVLPVVALLTLAIDQVSKSLVVTRLELGQSMDLASWLAPIFQLTYVTNTGVVFGLLRGLGNLFSVVPLAVILVVLLYYRRLPPGHVLVRICLGLLLGGAIGNLVDRLLRGSVVDFIDVNFWPLRDFPLYNLADASIVTGVGILALTILLEPREEPQPEEGKT